MQKKYIALLRGINVSGQKKIKMADLRSHLQELAIENIETYIQSGNILFESAETASALLALAIKNKIKEKYTFDVPTLVLPALNISAILNDCPFSPATGQETDRIYFTLLADEPTAERIAKLTEIDYSPEQYVLKGKTIYFYSPNSYGRAKMNNNFFESQLEVQATTRNWKTMHKLVEMAGL